MKNQICAIFTAAALACAISMPAAAQQNNAPKLKRVQMSEEKKSIPKLPAQ